MSFNTKQKNEVHKTNLQLYFPTKWWHIGRDQSVIVREQSRAHAWAHEMPHQTTCMLGSAVRVAVVLLPCPKMTSTCSINNNTSSIMLTKGLYSDNLEEKNNYLKNLYCYLHCYWSSHRQLCLASLLKSNSLKENLINNNSKNMYTIVI